MEGADPEFARKLAPGDILVVGRNFGCGSSREAAPVAIKAAGIEVVIAHSFARLFFRNAVNVGLPVLVSPSASQGIEQGEELEIDLTGGIIYSRTANLGYQARQFGGIVQEIIDSGGMVGYVRERLHADHRKPRENHR
jgi:3-isopropylmalate/(R)-2-methylmalate dehydratase small subunit